MVLNPGYFLKSFLLYVHVMHMGNDFHWIFSFFSRMEEPLESYNQAQRATTTILNTSHPAEHINFFTARPPTSSMNSQVIKIDSNCSNLSRLVQIDRNMSKLV